MLLTACAAHKQDKQRAQWLKAFGASVPAGTIRLNDSLYYDRTEITNFYWLEYEFWTRSVFGPGSPEHNAVLPDTTVWDSVLTSVYMDTYLRHPAYRDYPVVGVTHEQAVAYSRWRSDRVFEYYLVHAGVIPRREGQTAEDHFSIERFYTTDSLRKYHHLPYPSYTLPTYSEWKLAATASDSLAVMGIKRCRKFRSYEFRGSTFGECSDLISKGRFVVNSKERGEGLSGDPTAAVQCERCTADLIWNIRGNVAELSHDSTVVLGGGWTDPLEAILLDGVLPSQAPSAATGFRNVCRWRTWNGSRE